MIHHSSKRLPFLATGLAVALGFMSPAQGEDKLPLTPSDKTTASSTAKQVTMTGKVVNLHQFMTGQAGSATSTDRPIPTDRSKLTDRITPPDRTKPADRDDATHDKHQQAGGMNNEIMGLDTSTGLVLICFQDAPALHATPRLDDAPATPPANPVLPTAPRTPKLQTPPVDREKDTDKARDQGSMHWHGKQVEVSGMIYEKDGIKFLVVNKVTASSDASTTLPNKTTPRP